MANADQALDVFQVPYVVGRAGTPVALHRDHVDFTQARGQPQVWNFFFGLTDQLKYVQNGAITLA